MSKFWNDKIKNIEPYTPGEQPKDKSYIKLNTNENPYPPSKKVIQAIKEVVNENLRLYPSPTCDELRDSIANYYGIKREEVFVGNGSDEVLAFSFMSFFQKDRKIFFPDISYSFYKVYAELFDLSYELIPINIDFSMPLDKFMKANGGIIIANPNAPTSKYVDKEDLEKLLKKNRNSVIIIDEAYIDFGGESMVEFIKLYSNLLVIQTFSKSRSLAGLRVGFAMGSEMLIKALEIIKNSINSYTVDRVAISGAIAAINDIEYFDISKGRIIKTRERITVALKHLGFEVLDSKANFLFISHSNVNAKDLYKYLKERGILVRYFERERISNFLRVTIGTEEEMNKFLDEIKKIIHC